MPGREAGAGLRDVAAPDRARFAGARPLAHRGEAGHPLTDAAFDGELAERGQQDDGDGDRRLTEGESDGDAPDQADREVPVLHRQPERAVQPLGEAVHHAEHADLERVQLVAPLPSTTDTARTTAPATAMAPG